MPIVASAPPAGRPLGRVLLRVLFAAYLFGLLVWLSLGLLPTLAQELPPVRNWLTDLATKNGPFAVFAGRVLGMDTAELASSENAWVQYGFSLLNLVLGLVLVWRRLDRLVPCLLGFAMLGTAATFNDVSHRAFHITGSPGPVAFAHFCFHVVSGVAYFWAVVLFPDGRLPWRGFGSRTTRLVVGLVTVGMIVLCWRSSFLSHPQFFVVFFGVVVPVVGVAAQALRLRDSTVPPPDLAVARLLLAALLPAFSVSVCWLGARLFSRLGAQWSTVAADWLEMAFPVVFAVVPVVLVAGLLRYRLWDLDRILVRLLVYGLIAGGVGLVYLAAVLTGSKIAGGQLWWLVLVLATATAVIEPVRRWATGIANRIVYGRRISPTDALRDLVDGMRYLSPHGTLDQVETVAVAATRAARAELWLVEGDDLVRLPAGQEPIRIPAPNGQARQPAAVTVALGADECLPVKYQGELLGYLAVTAARGAELAADDRTLLADLATHAGLLAHNATLSVRLLRDIDELTERSSELVRTRRLLVEAQDTERRRLERNLHDGAQQAVVAALLGIRAVEVAADVDTELENVSQVLTVARQWTQGLLADEIPQVVADLGLAAALEQAAAVARRTGLAVTVTDDLSPAPATEVHAAAYFCCLEALQNATKYANAKNVQIGLSDPDGMLTFMVIDDGRGFDAQHPDDSGGLSALAQRCAVLGGDLAVDSRRGAGTRVRGRIPLTPAALTVASSKQGASTVSSARLEASR